MHAENSRPAYSCTFLKVQKFQESSKKFKEVLRSFKKFKKVQKSSKKFKEVQRHNVNNQCPYKLFLLGCAMHKQFKQGYSSCNGYDDANVFSAIEVKGVAACCHLLNLYFSCQNSHSLLLFLGVAQSQLDGAFFLVEILAKKVLIKHFVFLSSEP
jgi:hypothetical protein